MGNAPEVMSCHEPVTMSDQGLRFRILDRASTVIVEFTKDRNIQPIPEGNWKEVVVNGTTNHLKEYLKSRQKYYKVQKPAAALMQRDGGNWNKFLDGLIGSSQLASQLQALEMKVNDYVNFYFGYALLATC